MSEASWPPIYLGVVFTTLATLVLELSLTRIFSVVFYYHFAFLAISIALFGLGVGGVFSYLVAARKGNFFGKLGTLAALNSLAVVVSLVYVITRSGQLSNLTLALVYFASALPFFFSGTNRFAGGLPKPSSVSTASTSSTCSAPPQGAWSWCRFSTALADPTPFSPPPCCSRCHPPSGSIAPPTPVDAQLLSCWRWSWLRCSPITADRASSTSATPRAQTIPQENFTKWNSFSRIGRHSRSSWASSSTPTPPPASPSSTSTTCSTASATSCSTKAPASPM